MKITRVELRELRLPLVSFFETSFGRTTHRRIVLVRVEADGLTGWGEVTCGEKPFYSYETPETAWHILRDYLIPWSLEGSWGTASDLADRFRPIRGDPIGIQENVEVLLEKIERELAAGYERIKIKVEPGWDIEVLERIRSRFPDIQLMVDANSAYTLADFDHLKQFDRFDLMMIEQPLGWDDMVDHARLQKELQTPLCLDESIHSADDARKALDLGACRIINIKLGRVSGYTSARNIHDLCRSRGVPVWCGGM